MDQELINFDEVGVSFANEQIYDKISFDVHAGEFVCILGPSGCGKSTSLRIMGDLLEVTTGDVTVDGRPPKESWRELAYVFQSPRLAPWRNAIDNVTLGMELRFDGVTKSKMREHAEELLTMVGLENDMEKFPSMLSGGERQRVAIARALSVDPKIILMDEPFSALDLNTRRKMREEIVSIWEQTGKTIVFVTHDIDEALILADRIILMSNKPTNVLEVIELDELRPRIIDDSEVLKTYKKKLVNLFRSLEPGYEEGT